MTWAPWAGPVALRTSCTAPEAVSETARSRAASLDSATKATVGPDPEQAARRVAASRAAAELLSGYTGPATTKDGHAVAVLANVQDGAGARAQVVRRQSDGTWLRVLDQPEFTS